MPARAYNLLGLTQDGVPPGSFSGVTMQANGAVIVNYNNGQTRTIAQIPIVTFNAPNQLQRQNGQAFTATLSSGTPVGQRSRDQRRRKSCHQFCRGIKC